MFCFFLSYILYDSPKGEGNRRAFLQLFNVLIIREVYNSLQLARPLYEVQQIRVMEACFESAPQALIQLYFILAYSKDIQSSIVMLSLVFTLISLARAANYTDIFGLAKPESLKQDNAQIIENALTPSKGLQNENLEVEMKASEMSIFEASTPLSSF